MSATVTKAPSAPWTYTPPAPLPVVRRCGPLLLLADRPLDPWQALWLAWEFTEAGLTALLETGERASAARPPANPPTTI